MNWIECITNSINFIENNLTNDKLSPELVAKNQYITNANLGRAFHVLTNMTISEYIRNRRLSLAAKELTNSEAKVIDIALKFGYDSPEAFSKAFKRYHGINPSEVNTKPNQIKYFSPLKVKVLLAEEELLKVDILEKNSFTLCGNSETVPGDDALAATNLWKRVEKDGVLDQLYALDGFLNIAGVYGNDGKKEVYTIMAISSISNSHLKTNIPIPNGKWAVFKCEGDLPSCIDQTWKSIYSQWLANTTYEIAELPQLEVYYDDNDSYACDIWIPLKTFNYS